MEIQNINFLLVYLKSAALVIKKKDLFEMQNYWDIRDHLQTDSYKVHQLVFLAVSLFSSRRINIKSQIALQSSKGKQELMNRKAPSTNSF